MYYVIIISIRGELLLILYSSGWQQILVAASSFMTYTCKNVIEELQQPFHGFKIKISLMQTLKAICLNICDLKERRMIHCFKSVTKSGLDFMCRSGNRFGSILLLPCSRGAQERNKSFTQDIAWILMVTLNCGTDSRTTLN